MSEKETKSDWVYFSAVGQDSHRFVTDDELDNNPDRPLILGGVSLNGERPLAGNSDADVVLHALTNALSGITTINILGARADSLCFDDKITDSRFYLNEALQDLADQEAELIHLSVAIEAKKPHLSIHFAAIRSRLSEWTGLPEASIGLTATSGEGLTALGCGEGIQVFCLVSVRKRGA